MRGRVRISSSSALTSTETRPAFPMARSINARASRGSPGCEGRTPRPGCSTSQRSGSLPRNRGTGPPPRRCPCSINGGQLGTERRGRGRTLLDGRGDPGLHPWPDVLVGGGATNRARRHRGDRLWTAGRPGLVQDRDRLRCPVCRARNEARRETRSGSPGLRAINPCSPPRPLGEAKASSKPATAPISSGTGAPCQEQSRSRR